MRFWFRGAVPFIALLFCSRLAVAQDPDTTKPVQDTTKAPVLADSVRPIDQFARHAYGPANGFSDGVWSWDREALMLEGPVTLSDLLERVPGVLSLRSGHYLQPEAASALGGVGNRIEIWFDNYVLDPMLESTFDLSTLELAELASVRIERRLGTLRVFIETLAAKDTRAYSVIEAAVAEPRANLFRGVFLPSKFLFGPLGLAIDRMDTRGRLGTENADQFAGWAKWAFVRKNYGAQIEYRRINTDRDDDEPPWAGKYVRSDIIARARVRPATGLVAELFGGRSNQKNELDADSVEAEDESTQWGGALSYTSPVAWGRASYRFRDAGTLPKSQLDAAIGGVFKYGAVTAQVTQTDWRATGNATEYSLRGEAGPPIFRVFGEVTSSDRGVPYLPLDTAAGGGPICEECPVPAFSNEVITNYEGWRAGAQLNWRGISLGGAWLKAKADTVTTFGLAFDRTNLLYPGFDATGWEVSGRVPLYLIKGLYATGMINDWREGSVSIYMPTRNYRAGLELHTIPLKSGNLEVLGRLEVIHRDVMTAPNLAEDATTPTITQPAVDYFDAYLEIRIIDVRAFVRYEDLSGEKVEDVPGRALPGPRILYGVKWQFFN